MDAKTSLLVISANHSVLLSLPWVPAVRLWPVRVQKNGENSSDYMCGTEWFLVLVQPGTYT